MSNQMESSAFCDVPADWHLVRMDKYLEYVKCQISPEVMADRDVFHYSIPVVQVLGTGAMEDGSTIDSNKFVVDRELLLVSKLNPRKATICLAAPSKSLTVCSTEFVPIAAHGIDIEFVQYVTLSDPYRQRLESLTESATRSHQRVAPSDILKFWWPVPDKMTQEQVVRFLDRETAKIDALIAKQEQLIATLREDRAATITQAVTKGLDPNVEMKDSGVGWIGQSPANWQIRQIKWGSPVKRGASPRPIDDPKYFDDEGEWSWVRIADVSSSSGRLRETTQRLSVLGSSLSVKLNPGSLFISIAGTVGKPCITEVPACIHDGFVYFPTLDLDSEYLYRIFEAGECYKGLGKMGTQLNLNTDTIGSIHVPFPPREEQRRIVLGLEERCAKVDALIAKSTEMIETLREYRSALITDAVTGKIDVRGVA
ncbi:restriction endonuclease subunit S [Rhodococcus sp. NPDC058532]|uniref:restriction endonuclease subunit S n=1 Tax=Rhodococcus sp. NPDC058532 TaxID=3346540 RepID=UPI00365BD8D8